MFCPQCGSQQSEELKFCKLCGANLQAVLQVMATRETGEKFDWSKTWVAEMFLSGEERVRRTAEIERLPVAVVKRYKEIKAGVITGSVGLGGAIFLYVLMQGIILSGNVPPDAAEILSRLWVAGVIPLFVGIALIINGLFVSRRLVEIAGQRPEQSGPNILERDTDPHSLRPAGPSEFIPSGFSVTEETTQHLGHSRQKQEAPNEPKR